MNINAFICQAEQLAGTLHHGGMGPYSTDELRALVDALELAKNIIYGEILHRIEQEREANPAKEKAATGGLLDALRQLPTDGGDAA